MFKKGDYSAVSTGEEGSPPVSGHIQDSLLGGATSSTAIEDRNARLSKTSDFEAMSPIVRPENPKYLTAFLLLNNMIGSGILNQPFVFMKSGFLGGIVGYIIASYMVWSSVNMLTDAGLATKIYEFQGLAKHAYGEIGEQLVDVSIIMLAIGALVGYILVVGSTLSDLLMSWGCTNQTVCGQDFVTVFSVVVFVAPVCMLRHFGHLAWLSIFSIGTIVAVLFLVLIGGPLHQVHGDELRVFEPSGFIMSLGSIVFALSISSANFQAFVSTEKSAQNETAWKEVTGIAVLAGALMCVSMGLVGYLSFRNSTDGVILDNFESSDFDVFKLMVGLHLIFYIPVMFIIMRYSLVKLVMNKMSETLPTLDHSVLSLLLLAGIVGIVMLLRAAGLASGDAFALTLNITGGIAGTMTSFVLPTGIYLKLMPSGTRTYLEAQIIHVLGYALMILVLTTTIMEFV